jgi:alpha-mannosidase
MNCEEFIVEKITNFLDRLRKLVTLDIQDKWLENNSDSSLCLNEKRYIIFPKGRETIWLIQKIIIPEHLEHYSLSGFGVRLVLTWWAEDAKIFINNELVQEGDLFDSSARILITDRAIPKTEYLVKICLVSPNHDIGALMKSSLVYEQNNYRIDPGFVADELTILLKYLSRFASDKLAILESEINKLDWNIVSDRESFDRNLINLRTRLLPLSNQIKNRCFNLLGHAHLDMAWLWTSEETYSVAQRTFTSVLNLQQNFPHLTFGHTTPALYQWLGENRPDLLADIQQAVDRGQWEILGGMWVEPEVNLISGESLIRQLLYGQQYLQATFGEIAKVAWLPDSFGFTWQLPQIFKQSGIKYFVTGKLHWNDTNQFPLGCFWWESPDGTKIFTLMSPPNLTGVMDTNPLTMVNYAIDWEAKTGLSEIFWLPGVGDHGGGPSRDMLEVATKWQQSPFFPEIKFTKAIDYLQKITNYPHSTIPIWRDELYLELHRGCYTTHADQKRFNRYCEGLLYEAELFATVTSLLFSKGFSCTLFSHYINNNPKNKNCQPWQSQIELAWKKVLFNQFHDILPGTSIPEVFTEANRDWEEAIEIGENILQLSLETIAACIDVSKSPITNAQGIVVFNSLNWKRSEIVSIAAKGKQWQVLDDKGNRVRSQISSDDRLLFLAENIPSIGYRLYWIKESETVETLVEFNNYPYVLENNYLKITINSETGDLDSIYDRQADKEIIKPGGNRLQAFVDKGQYWDAWNIDPNYEQYPLPPAKLKSIQWLDRGELEQRIKVIKNLGNSEFQQEYILETNSPILKITNTVNWQETNILVKAAFPLNIISDSTTYEIPCGVIERTNEPKTAEEKAKWEVSALKWIDLTNKEQNYGVSILNDGKYGYDSQSDRLRITLLRSPLWPDPRCDRGIHHFTYAIYPHENSWQEAKTVHRSYELNLPLRTIELDSQLNKQTASNQFLNTKKTFLNISAQNLILMAFKPSDNGKIALRFYECHGQKAAAKIENSLNLELLNIVDFLEREKDKNIDLDRLNLIKVEPWQIVTYNLNRSNLIETYEKK